MAPSVPSLCACLSWKGLVFSVLHLAVAGRAFSPLSCTSPSSFSPCCQSGICLSPFQVPSPLPRTVNCVMPAHIWLWIFPTLRLFYPSLTLAFTDMQGPSGDLPTLTVLSSSLSHSASWLGGFTDHENVLEPGMTVFRLKHMLKKTVWLKSNKHLILSIICLHDIYKIKFAV